MRETSEADDLRTRGAAASTPVDYLPLWGLFGFFSPLFCCLETLPRLRELTRNYESGRGGRAVPGEAGAGPGLSPPLGGAVVRRHGRSCGRRGGKRTTPPVEPRGERGENKLFVDWLCFPAPANQMRR